MPVCHVDVRVGPTVLYMTVPKQTCMVRVRNAWYGMVNHGVYTQYWHNRLIHYTIVCSTVLFRLVDGGSSPSPVILSLCLSLSVSALTVRLSVSQSPRVSLSLSLSLARSRSLSLFLVHSLAGPAGERAAVGVLAFCRQESDL